MPDHPTPLPLALDLTARIAALEGERDRLAAEVQRAAPVIAAAEALIGPEVPVITLDEWDRLYAAVRLHAALAAYRAARAGEG